MPGYARVLTSIQGQLGRYLCLSGQHLCLCYFHPNRLFNGQMVEECINSDRCKNQDCLTRNFLQTRIFLQSWNFFAIWKVFVNLIFIFCKPGTL